MISMNDKHNSLCKGIFNSVFSQIPGSLVMPTSKNPLPEVKPTLPKAKKLNNSRLYLVKCIPLLEPSIMAVSSMSRR